MAPRGSASDVVKRIILGDLRHLDDADPVVYERIVAGMLRLIADLLESDRPPDWTPREVDDFLDGTEHWTERADPAAHRSAQ